MKKLMITVTVLVAIVFLAYAPAKTVEAAGNEVDTSAVEEDDKDEFKPGEIVDVNCIEEGIVIRKGATLTECYGIDDCQIWVGNDCITSVSLYNDRWTADRDYKVTEVVYDEYYGRTSIFATLETIK